MPAYGACRSRSFSSLPIVDGNDGSDCMYARFSVSSRARSPISGGNCFVERPPMFSVFNFVNEPISRGMRPSLIARYTSSSTRFLHAKISVGNVGNGANSPLPAFRHAAGLSATDVTFAGFAFTSASGSTTFFFAIVGVLLCYTSVVLLRETFPAGPFECNCTVLACGDTKDAVVIDPGGEVERIAEIVAQYDLTVRAIVHTHAHLDHIYCTRDVKEAHGGAVCLHKGDAFLYDGFAMQAQMFGWKVRESTAVERWIEHGDTIEMGKRKLEVVHTPGHTPGSVCFEVEGLLFAGD